MTKLSRILKDYQESGAMNALLSIHAAIDEHTFLTKSGHVMMMLSAKGVDSECLEPSQLDQIARGFESAVRILGDDFRLYQYLVKRDQVSIPYREYEHPVVQEAASGRVAYLKEKAATLYSLEIYFVIVYEGWKHDKSPRETISRIRREPLAGLRQALSQKSTITILEQELDRARETLANRVMSFVVQTPDALGVKVLSTQEGFRFLRRLLNYEPFKADNVSLKFNRFVDYQACDSALECYRDHLRLDDFYVQALTLKEPPARTFAHLLRGLQELACNYVIATEWKRQPNARMLRLIHSKRRHFHNVKTALAANLTATDGSTSKDRLVNNADVALVAELGACLEELEVNGHSFGEFSLTVILYDKDRGALRRSVAECYKVFAAGEAQLTEESYNLLNAWLAVVPGNGAYNLRALWLLDTNYADLSFLFAPHMGELRNGHLGDEYLAVLESNHGTPYYLNLHYQDLGHSLALGATGSGKSFFLNFLLTHLQKYQPFTFLFDIGRSYENITRLFDGIYLPIGLETRSFTINPFTLPPTKENLHFLFLFVKVLIESGAYRMTDADERDLYEQIENVYAVEPDQRRLLTLSNMLSRSARGHLQKWVGDGPYAAWFDNAADNLTFARFQTFDFDGMDKYPQVLEALLFYILHRATAAIGDETLTTTLKLFVIDEAWCFLRHPTIKLYILEALKTWRKKNAAMVLATQSTDDLLRSEMLSVVVESCATKMFLANPDLDPNAYREIFHLNETETGLISRLVPKKQILVKRPDMAKVVNLNVDRKDYWLYTSSPYDRERRREAFERYGFKQGLEILARSAPT